MAYEKCIEQIVAAAGRDLTPEETAHVAERVKGILNRLDKVERAGGDAAAALDDLLRAEEDALKQDKLIAKRNIALNAQKSMAADEMISNIWSDDPAMGFNSLMRGTLSDRQGSRDSTAAAAATARHAKVAAFGHELEEKGLFKAARSGKFDLEVRRYEAARAKGEDTSSFSKTAAALADVYVRHQDVAAKELNMAGAWIGQLEGRVARQSHDMWKISKAAGAQFGDEANFKAWHEAIYPLIDWTRTMTEVPISERTKRLKSLWTQFSAGKHLSFEDAAPPSTGKGFANLAKRSSHERVIHFKDADAEHAYFQQFGIGDSLFETVVHSLDFAGRDLGIMRKLGPNARANWDRLYDKWRRKLTSEGDLEKLKKLDKAYKENTEKVWPIVSGEGSVSDSKALAAVSETMINFIRMGDLGGMALNSFGDLNNAASTLSYFGDRSNAGFFQNTYNSVAYFVKHLGRGLSAEEKRFAAKELGVLLDGIHMPVSNMFSDSILPGMAAKATQRAYWLFGTQWMQNRIRMNSMAATAVGYGQRAAKTFDKLPEGMQAALRQFNISPEEWDIIRQGKTDFRGDTAISTEAIRALPDIDAKTRTAVADKYGRLVAEIANLCVTTPTAATRAIATQGLKRGTWKGEAFRHLLLFRSYPISYMRNHLGRELHGYHPDRVGTAEAILRMFKEPGSGSLAGVSRLIGGGLFYGAISVALSDLAQGKQPLVPHDAKSFGVFFKDAFTRSGALGLYGDLVSGQIADYTSGTDYLFNLLGPSARRLGQAADVAVNAVRGDFGPAERKAWRLFYSTIPGRNLFYTRWATDYLILNRIAEMLNPGYLQRMEQGQEDATGKQYLVRPSDVVPYGG